MEKGKESGIDATEALAIETAQKAYDDTLKEYNEGVDQVAAVSYTHLTLPTILRV